MHSRATRTLIALTFAVFIAVAASAAPEGRGESGDWIGRQLSRIVLQLKKLFTSSPFDDTDSNLNPPHP